jgi:4-hydroxy-L-threonine phosphate dehydrogenase PdxA
MNAQAPAAARTRPRIGLTIGDPAGIGPEVTLKAARKKKSSRPARR